MTDQPIELRVTLGADGFRVQLPSGRSLNVSADAAGARFMAQMLRDAEAHRKYDIQQRGYVNGFPTQDFADRWARAEANRLRLAEQAKALLAEEAQRKAEARERSRKAKAKQRERVWAKRGVDISKIKINL